MKPDPLKFPSPLSRSDSKKSAANSRWKWMAGSSAAGLAAASTTGLAAPVQITQVGSVITPDSGTLDADLTKDGVDDIDLRSNKSPQRTGSLSFGSAVSANFYTIVETTLQAQRDLGNVFFARMRSILTGPITYNAYKVNAGGGTASPRSYYFYTYGTGGDLPDADVSGMSWVTFTDSRINGGNPIKGLIETRGRINANGPSLQIVRLIFDEADPDNYPDIAAGAPRLTEYVSPAEKAQIAAQKAKIRKQIKKATKQLKAAKRNGKKAAAKRLSKKIRRLKAQLRRL